MATKYLTFNKESDNLLLTAGRLRNPLIGSTQEPLSVTSGSSLTIDTSDALIIDSTKLHLDSNGHMDLTGVLKVNGTDVLTSITSSLTTGQDASFTNVDISGILDLTNNGKIRGPSVMYIDPYRHEDNSGSLVVLGNLEVKGTTFTVHSQTVEISDNKISINADWNTVSDAGISINLPGGNNHTELVWYPGNNRWQVTEDFHMNKDLIVEDTLTVTDSFSSNNFKFGGTNFNNSLKIGSNTTGTLNQAAGNTLIGINCANSITSGHSNTALGFESLKDATIGYHNTSIGTSSMTNIYNSGAESNNAGCRNTAVGSFALHKIGEGRENTAIGSHAAEHAGNGVNFMQNIAIGYSTLGTCNADNNVAIGVGSLTSLTGTTCKENVAVGGNSGWTITSGSQNTCIGRSAITHHPTNVNSIVLGYNTTGNGSNTVTIGNNSITATYLRGTLNLNGSPLELDDLNDGNVKATSSYFIGGGGNLSTGGSNSCFGHQSGLDLTSGVNNTLFGTAAGKTLTTQQNNILLGRETARQAACSYSTYIGVAAGFSSTATHNIGLGQGTAYANNGAYNIAIGPPANGHVDTFTFHSASSTCTGNIAIGEASMQRNQTTPSRNGETTWTGTNNICIGKWSSLNAANTSNAIAIGHSVLANSNEIVLGNSSVTSFQIPGLDFSIIDNSLSFVGNADISGSLTTGFNNTASGLYSVAFGQLTRASGPQSFAVGYNNTAQNNESIALGSESNAYGHASLACGFFNNSFGNYSSTFGHHSIATGEASTVFGQYNIYDNSKILIIGTGTGTSISQRNNGLTLDYSANLYLDGDASFNSNVEVNGDLTVNGTLSMNGAFTIPNTDGSVDQVLKTNGSGVLSWTTIDPALSFGPAVSNNQVTDNEHHSWLGYNSLSVGSRSVTLGWKSGGGNDSACYGKYAGFGGGNSICAVGTSALGHGAGNCATAMGQAAGGHIAGTGSVNLGYWAGQTTSQQYSVNIGYYSGKTSAGDYSINIGANTNKNVACADNSITINSTGQVTTCSSTNKAICITADPSLVTTTESGLYIAPVRENTGTNLLSYDISSYEISYLADGSTGQVLTTNGSGVTSWTNSKTHLNTFSVVDASNLQTNLTKTAGTWIDLSGTSNGYKVSVTPSTTNCRVKLEFKVNYVTSNESDQQISFRVIKNPGAVKVFQDVGLGTSMGVTSRGIYNGSYIDHPNSTSNVSYHLEYRIEGSDIDISSGVLGYEGGNGSYNFICAQELFAP